MIPEEELLTDTEVESALRSLHLQFLPTPHPSTWLLPFVDPSTGTADLLGVENGRGNPAFISVFLTLVQVRDENRQCILRALSLANGQLALVKFVLTDDGTVAISVPVPRLRALFQSQMLKHALQSVLAAAAFIRPILTACHERTSEDIEEIFEKRVAEVSGKPPNIIPPRPRTWKP